MNDKPERVGETGTGEGMVCLQAVCLFGVEMTAQINVVSGAVFQPPLAPSPCPPPPPEYSGFAVRVPCSCWVTSTHRARGEGAVCGGGVSGGAAAGTPPR